MSDTLVFQVFIDDDPQKKHFKRCSYASARMLGTKRNFKKYAEKYGFVTLVNDENSFFEYSYRDEANRVMSLRLIDKI